MCLQLGISRPDSGVLMSFDVPILLLTWRRPDTTKQVVDALRSVSPTNLYVASDGPRNKQEAIKVKETRDLIDQKIDWPCHVSTLYSAANQGCEQGVSKAISWFFTHVEEGIILEDDCVPHQDFFSYCKQLLDFYRDDLRIWCISGNNFQDGVCRGQATYYFSRFNHCWGWATWRDRWNHYDDQNKLWSELRNSPSCQKSIFPNPVERDYWLEIWNSVFGCNSPDSWAYRWALVCMSNRALTCLPNSNLVFNIGFGEDSTHTHSHMNQGRLPESFSVTSHPILVCNDDEADNYSFDHHYGGLAYQKSKSFLYPLQVRLGLLWTNPLSYARRIFSKYFS